MEITKKLRNIVDAKLPEYVFKRYPFLVQFVYGFIDFLDNDSTIEALNLDNNLDPQKMFARFLPYYFEQYCNDLIDPRQYQLTSENKRIILSIIRFLNENKGKVFSFDVALKYITRFFVGSDDIYFETIDYEIIESADRWDSVRLGHPKPEVWIPHKKPFTYTIKGDFVRSHMISLINNLNPVGFYPEFLFEQYQEDQYDAMSNTSDLARWGEGPGQKDQYNISDMTSDENHHDQLWSPHLIESFQAYSDYFFYNGNFRHDGSRKYNGRCGGIFENYSIEIELNGVLFETFEEIF